MTSISYNSEYEIANGISTPGTTGNRNDTDADSLGGLDLILRL